MAKTERTLKSITRTFATTAGELTYAQLADLVAPKLAQLLDDINNGKYRTHPLNEDLILAFHQQIIGDLIPAIAGHWRKVAVQVGNWLPPEPPEIPILMREYTQNLATRLENANNFDLQIEALAYAEGEFLHIHPFQDFNGRTVRALLSELLVRLDLPPVDTSVKRKTAEFTEYQEALAEYDNQRTKALRDFWVKRFSK